MTERILTEGHRLTTTASCNCSPRSNENHDGHTYPPCSTKRWKRWNNSAFIFLRSARSVSVIPREICNASHGTHVLSPMLSGDSSTRIETNVALEQNAERPVYRSTGIDRGGEISRLRYELARARFKTRHSAIDSIDSTVSSRGMWRAARSRGTGNVLTRGFHYPIPRAMVKGLLPPESKVKIVGGPC